MTEKPKILCVDDEQNVLEGLKLHLRKLGTVLTATSGPEGLEILKQQPDIAVVMSDMRMPKMDGATFLENAKDVRPEATRILLTGFADVESAIHAVNKGQLFRFLTKPCPPDQLQITINAALEQHRLVTGEKVLLQKTLMGAVRALIEVLTLADPMAMGRAVRLKERIRQVSKALGIQQHWQVELAAVFSQLSSVSLEDETRVRIYQGEELSSDEKSALAQNMRTLNNIVSNIPRLEPVTEILGELTKESSVTDKLQTRLLRAIIELDNLESRGVPLQEGLKALAGRPAEFDTEFLGKLRKGLSDTSDIEEEQFVAIKDLKNGMTIIDDVYSKNGVLIVSRGIIITATIRDIIIRHKDKLREDTIRIRPPRGI